MERDSGDRESPAQRHADTAVVGLVPDDLGPDCVGIDDQPVVKGLAGDISDDLEDCRLVAGKGSGVKIDVSGWTSASYAAMSTPPLSANRPACSEAARRHRKPSSAYNWCSSSVGRRCLRARFCRSRYARPSIVARVGRLSAKENLQGRAERELGLREMGGEVEQGRRVIAGSAQPPAQRAVREVRSFAMAEPERIDDASLWVVDADVRARFEG
jgi:hypothetical protein